MLVLPTAVLLLKLAVVMTLATVLDYAGADEGEAGFDLKVRM